MALVLAHGEHNVQSIRRILPSVTLCVVFTPVQLIVLHIRRRHELGILREVRRLNQILNAGLKVYNSLRTIETADEP